MWDLLKIDLFNYIVYYVWKIKVSLKFPKDKQQFIA